LAEAGAVIRKFRVIVEVAAVVAVAVLLALKVALEYRVKVMLVERQEVLVGSTLLVEVEAQELLGLILILDQLPQMVVLV
jgi:hypothetical protein